MKRVRPFHSTVSSIFKENLDDDDHDDDGMEKVIECESKRQTENRKQKKSAASRKLKSRNI